MYESEKRDCCSTNYCNTLEKIDLLNYTCEFNKKISPEQKLRFPIKNTEKTSALKCWYCDDCKEPLKEATIKICSPSYDEEIFYCEVS